MPKLSNTYCNNTKETKLHSDGGGLYFKVIQSKSVNAAFKKSWIFKWGAQGKRSMGLGSYPAISLAKARELSSALRSQIALGVDPIEQRETQKKQKQLVEEIPTFEQAAQQYIAIKAAAWSNSKHGDQWKNTLQSYAYPKIGALKVSDIQISDVLSVLEPIWSTKHETATRVCNRIASILDWCIVKSYRDAGINPAKYKGILEHALPKINKKHRVKHFEALPYKQISACCKRIRLIDTITSKALLFTILTASRTGEVIGAQWDEIDWEEHKWVVPAVRMKKRKEHHVPLSSEAMDLLKSLHEKKLGPFIFPSPMEGKDHISNMGMLTLVNRNLSDLGITVHGFRSCFRDWAGETTEHQREVIEHALAHQIADASEAAYQRGTLFEKRKLLMQDWATYCGGEVTMHK